MSKSISCGSIFLLLLSVAFRTVATLISIDCDRQPPVSQSHVPIAPGNADQIAQLSQFGIGSIDKILWSLKSESLFLAGTTGARVYNGGLQLVSFPICNKHVTHATFAPDGSMIALVTNDSSRVTLLDTQTYDEIATFETNSDAITDLDFSPDSKLLAVAVAKVDPEYGLLFDGYVQLWDLTNGSNVGVLREENALSVGNLKFVSGSDTILVERSYPGYGYSDVELWNVQTKTKIANIASEVNSVTPSEDGKLLAISPFNEDTTQTIQIWDVVEARMIRVIPLPLAASAVTFSPDSLILATGDDDGIIHLWDIGTGIERNSLHAYAHTVTHLAFNPEGTILASIGWDEEDGSLRLWSMGTSAQIGYLAGITQTFMKAVVFNPVDPVVAIGGEGSTAGLLRLWNYSANRMETRINETSRWINSVATNANGTLIAWGSEADVSSTQGLPHVVSIWNTQTNREMSLLGHTLSVASVSFSPDGHLLASAGENDGTIRLWDTDTGEGLSVLQHPDWGVFSVAFSSDGTALLSGSSDGIVRLWDIRTGQVLKTFQHGGRIKSVAFSPVDAMIASGSSDGSIKLWDQTTGQVIFTLYGHTATVNRVVFNPDGTLLVSASNDRTIRLWNVKTGTELSVLYGHTDWVNDVAFDQNGALLASASNDGTVRLWGIPSVP